MSVTGPSAENIPAPPSVRPAILVVEDDPLIARSLRSHMSKFGEVRCRGTLGQAREELKDDEFDAMVLDVGLPDGSGMDFLNEVRDNGFAGPVLVLTGRLERSIVIGTQSANAYYLTKPAPTANLDAFGSIVRAHSKTSIRHINRVARAAAARFGLSDREMELLVLALRGVMREDLAGVLGVEESTVRTHLKKIMRKTGMRTLRDLVDVLLALDEPRLRDQVVYPVRASRTAKRPKAGV